MPKHDKTSRHHITWQNPWDSMSVRLRISHTRNYLGTGDDHLAIESITPPKAPIPITETGYLSHFIQPDELLRAGGARQFVQDWLATEGLSKQWQQRDAARRQGNLFQWAEAQAELAQPAAPNRAEARARARQRLHPKPKGRGHATSE
jgi:hypothetical protein